MTSEQATQFVFALDGLIRSRTKGHGGEEYARKCIHEMIGALVDPPKPKVKTTNAVTNYSTWGPFD